MRTLVIIVLLWVLLLSLGPGAVLADPGSNNGNGRGNGQSSNAAQQDRGGNPGNNGVGRGNGGGNHNASASGRGQGVSGEVVAPSPTVPPSPAIPKPRMFSLQGKFASWFAVSVDTESAVMQVEVVSCNRVVRDAVLGEDGDILHIVVTDRTLYHVYGGGGGFSTGLVGTDIPAGARVHIVGTASYAEKASGGVTEAPVTLYATRVLVQLDDADAADDA
jgi:hypothetical protein